MGGGEAGQGGYPFAWGEAAGLWRPLAWVCPPRCALCRGGGSPAPSPVGEGVMKWSGVAPCVLCVLYACACRGQGNNDDCHAHS